MNEIKDTQDMTATEKRKAKALKRKKAKREKKKQEKLEKFNDEELVADEDRIYESFKKCEKGTLWKTSVQKEDYNILYNVVEISDKIRNHKSLHKEFNSFTLNERGKERHINATDFEERVAHKTLNDYVLMPLFEDYFIYDNVASIKGGGTKKAEERLLKQLRDYYNEHGNFEGYIVMFDVHHYFESIDREKLIAYIEPYLLNDTIRWLYKDLVHSFDEIFPDNKGLGLGSQISQHAGLAYVNPIDHYVKDQLSKKGYGRYMDDSYIIVETLEEAKEIIVLMEEAYTKIGLELNNKTKICRLDKPFRYLKKKHICLPNGKIYKKIWRKNICNERKRLREHKHLLDEGRITPNEVFNQALSWNNGNKVYNCYHERMALKEYYQSLGLPKKRTRRRYDKKGKVIAKIITFPPCIDNNS